MISRAVAFDQLRLGAFAQQCTSKLCFVRQRRAQAKGMLGRKVEKTSLKFPRIPHHQSLFAICLSRVLFNQQCVVQKLPDGSSDGTRAIAAEQVLDFLPFPPAIEKVQDCD
jgi:hypothetical protein